MAIDFDAIRKHGKTLGWKGGLNKRSVSELTLGLALDLLRNITMHDNIIKKGSWNRKSGSQLSHNQSDTSLSRTSYPTHKSFYPTLVVSLLTNLSFQISPKKSSEQWPDFFFG